jgi:hypothetical protein
MIARVGAYVRRNHLGLLALFVALGGTSYAALKLPAHSVGTTQLRNGAVTANKIRSGALRARHFRGGKLPRGARGAAGAAGPTGAAGPVGQTGPTGTVDTSNFYDKVASDGRFAPAGQIVYGSAPWDTASTETIVTIPELFNLRIQTTGTAEKKLRLLTDDSQGNHDMCLWEEGHPAGGGTFCGNMTAPQDFSIPSTGDLNAGVPHTLVLSPVDDPTRAVQVTCTFQDNGGNIVRCFALRSSPGG